MMTDLSCRYTAWVRVFVIVTLSGLIQASFLDWDSDPSKYAQIYVLSTPICHDGISFYVPFGYVL